MKLFLIASFIALCAATPFYGGKKIFVSESDDITFYTTEGIQVHFSRPDTNEQILNVVVNGPTDSAKFYKIYDYTWYNSHADEDVLANICREYQGAIDNITFEKLLYRIEKAVEMGLISHHVYEILAVLNKHDFDVVMQQQVLHQILEQYGVQSGTYGSQYGFQYGSGVYGNKYAQYFGGKSYYGNPLMKSFYGQQYYGRPSTFYKDQYNQHQLGGFVRQHVNNEVQQLAEEELLKEKYETAPFFGGKQYYGLGQYNMYPSFYKNFGYNKYSTFETPRIGGQSLSYQHLFGRQMPYNYGPYQYHYGQQYNY